LAVPLFFCKDGPVASECAIEKVFQAVEIDFEGAASDLVVSLADVIFDLLFGEVFGWNVAATLNTLENGVDVVFLCTGRETGEVHVVDKALA
jgi:hypothetical protein